MLRIQGRSIGIRAFLCAAASALAFPVLALDRLDFVTPGADDALRDRILAASLVRTTAESEEADDALALLGAARADYARIVGALYDQGYFGPEVSIRADGREVADIPLLAAPSRIGQILITVSPGPQFRFGEARIGPLPDGVVAPMIYRTGAPASTGAIETAARDAVSAWRDSGHAKAEVAGEQITADHRSRTLNAAVAVDPGPRLRFGNLRFEGETRVREKRLYEIAGFPTGEVYSPDGRSEAGDRLRRTGIFTSVAMVEAETPNPDGTLDVTAQLTDRKPRRFGFGAEFSSTEGIGTSGYWMHRNIFGGGENLRFDGAIEGIGEENGGIDYLASVRLSRPATFHPDASGFVFATLERLDDPNYITESATVGAGLSFIASEYLKGEAALTLDFTRSWSATGQSEFFHLTLPVGVEWDKRDNRLDAMRGFFLDTEAKPYLGLNDSQSGVRTLLDGRVYRSFGEGITLAARGQWGSIFGSSIPGTPPDDLFYSGGGGTVRGHAFQSLGVTTGGVTTGGRSFLGGSFEVRSRFGNNLGAVAFYDIGYIGANSLPDSTGGTHSGAGLGLRYNTGIGPIRLDVATPVSGPVQGSRVQIYIGIGQSF